MARAQAPGPDCIPDRPLQPGAEPPRVAVQADQEVQSRTGPGKFNLIGASHQTIVFISVGGATR